MSARRIIVGSAWAILTLVAIIWLALGNLSTEFGPLVLFAVAASLGYGPARIIALWRISRENPVLPRMVPLRVTSIFGAVLAFGPALAYIAGWGNIFTAAGCFLGGFIVISISAALFSDGYQGLWLDSLIFRGLKPPEDEWLIRRDVNRRNARRTNNQ